MATYYSPDAILTDSQKAPCVFELTVPQLTPLNNGSVVESGTKLDLPLWLAEMLAVSKPSGPSSGSLVTLDMPTPLGPRVMNALRADPKSVDVRSQAQRFYGLGERMLDLFDDEEVSEVLNDTFKQRAMEIADRAQNRHVQDAEFTRGLDESERTLFATARESSNAVKSWFENNSRS